MLSRIRIIFNRNILFKNVKTIIEGITKGSDKSIPLPSKQDGFFNRELSMITASLSDTLRPLLYDESEPTLTEDALVVCVSLYAKRQKQMLAPALEDYICHNIAYGYLLQNGMGYEVIDMRAYYNQLHHIVLMKDDIYSRKPNF